MILKNIFCPGWFFSVEKTTNGDKVITGATTLIKLTRVTFIFQKKVGVQ